MQAFMVLELLRVLNLDPQTAGRESEGGREGGKEGGKKRDRLTQGLEWAFENSMTYFLQGYSS